jgi:GNAT superfamily N-acetyltransferase
LTTLPIALSPLDTERWGVVTAKMSPVQVEQLPGALDFCQQNQVAFLIARCPVADLRAVQAMEQQGFLLMDTLLYFVRDLTALPPLPDEIRPVRAADAESVRNLAAQAFQNYLGHYHADERLDRAACNAVYESWAYRSCQSKQVADEVLVFEANGHLSGFITIKRQGAVGEGPLYGVDPAAQGQGIGRALMIGALHWLKSHGAQRMVMSTQVTNVSSQKVWVRLGFEPSHAEYTFHKWFDGG